MANCKVQCLAGEGIFDRPVKIDRRVDAVDLLGLDPSMDGLIISNEVGGCGFNMVAANHLIFLGSMYSAANEEQIIGTHQPALI